MKIKEKINELKLNYNKEMAILAIFNVVFVCIAIALYFLKFGITICLVPIFLGLIFSIYYLNRYNLMIDEREKRLDNEFIEIFSYLRIYLYNEENVYTSLKNIKEFASERMSQRLETLLLDIDEDKTIQPFLNFAKQFKNRFIEEVMISLYEMIDGGNKDVYLNQFIKIFEDFKNRSEKENEEKRYRKFDTINMLSIVGSGYIMIVLSMSVISLLGEATNGF